MLAHKKSRLY